MSKGLSKLKKCQVVNVTDPDAHPEPGLATVVIEFSNRTELQIGYWRIIKNNRASTSSFDHQQKYGLPALINAKEEIKNVLQGKEVLDAKLEIETGDIIIDFNDNLKLQVFNFTGYEVWEFRLPDGAVEYSNYNKEKEKGTGTFLGTG